MTMTSFKHIETQGLNRVYIIHNTTKHNIAEESLRLLPGTAKCFRGIEVSLGASEPIQSALEPLTVGLVFMLFDDLKPQTPHRVST